MRATLRSINADTVHLLPVYKVPDGQTLDDLDCPRVVARSRAMLSARLVMDLGAMINGILDGDDATWRPAEIKLLALAVLAVRIDGDWSLYAPGVPSSLPWPDVDDRDLEGSLTALRVRVNSLAELRQDDVDALDAALTRNTKLDETERGN